MSSGRNSRTKKLLKGGTSSTRKHRFQTRHPDTEINEDDPTASYFRTDLDRWKDLNLSEHFSNFVREITPLCDSLPQVVHHHAQIADILTNYIGKGDAQSLEPLLSLLASFAHDLASIFEVHFSDAVTLVVSLAAKHPEVEVIEWSFNCLAWLFKYLSRLLVPDLRPLLRIMSPFLGKEPQKRFTTRFAAESMSFLVRKAALTYHKTRKPLENAVNFLLEEVDQVEVRGSKVSTFQPLLGIALQKTQQAIQQGPADISSFTPLDACERLLCVLGTVRKGSRIQKWGPMLDALLSLLKVREEQNTKATRSLIEAAAVVMQSAPLDVLIPAIRPIMDRVANNQNQDQFLIFCDLSCELEKERFETLIRPYLAKFINSHWQTQQSRLYLRLPDIVGESSTAKVTCPAAWEQEIVNLFNRAEKSGEEQSIADCYNYLEAFHSMDISSSRNEAVINILQSMLHSALKLPSHVCPKTVFSLGAGLKACAEHGIMFDRKALWCPSSLAVEHYKKSPLFLEGILVSLKTETAVPESLLDYLVDQMIENLCSSSHMLRQLSLQIIQSAYMKAFGCEAEVVTTALKIESMPLDLKSARTISMYVRKFISQYKDVNLHRWLRKAVPYFCFGMQTFKLSPLWDDAIEVLKQVCEVQSGKELVSDLAFQWLESPVPKIGNDITVENSPARSLGDFECSNLNKVDAAYRDRMIEMEHPEEESVRRFHKSHEMSQGIVTNAPAIALRILLGIPGIAEKKSRRLVPLFLHWASADRYEESLGERPSSTSNESGGSDEPKFNGQDRKSMLRLFALFNNPRVLYRSTDVFGALRDLLANGDVEIQKPALNAIFAWKLEAVQPYQEHLRNILDDSRFRDEISTFLHTDQGNKTIQYEHRFQLMPILLRLLYGKLITRTGNQIAKRTQSLKRKVIFEALAQFEDAEIQEFLDIALRSSVPSQILDTEGRFMAASLQDMLSPRKQIGLLNVIKDLLNTLGRRLAPFTPTLTKAVVYCTVWACAMLSANSTDVDNDEDSHASLVKSIRQIGLNCLNLLFQHCATPEIQPYVPLIFAECINPKLKMLPVETAQSVSGMLQLFSTWASLPHLAFLFVQCNASLLETISGCLEVQFAKDDVKAFVLENILKRLVCLVEAEHASGRNEQQLQLLNRVLRPNLDIFLVHVGNLLRESPTKDLLASALEFVTLLAPIVEGSTQTKNMLELASFLLTQSSQRVSPRVKGDLLQILRHFVPQHDFRESEDLQDTIFATISSLFGYFKDRSNRVALVEVLSTLAEKDEELRRVAALCRSLNSYSATKIDDPDFDDRLQAYDAINTHEYSVMTTKEWQPVLYNMLYFIRDAEELAIRTNSSLTLRRFVQVNVVKKIHMTPQCSNLTCSVLLPALRKGVSDASELVRAEYLAVMAHLIRLNPDWDEVNDMNVLLVGDDEEASFFANVLHIQQHRRLRALRRLSAEARQDRLHSNNVAHFFVPLIEHFIFDRAEDESAHNLTAEAITTIGALALSLEWPQFRAIFGRYVGYIESKPDIEKSLIKLIGVLTESLSSASERKEERLPMAHNGGEDVPGAISPHKTGVLGRTIPRLEKLAEDLRRYLLPALAKYLHQKDESTVSLRVPVAVSAVKLLKLLPPDQIADALPPILTDVCNILRSRAQESRDLTRKTLVDIAVVVGPPYFGFILKELRRSLARGYQLHVLSYTVHSLLVGTAPNFKLGDLDYCLPQLVAVVMDDTFGVTGQEKDAEEYISKMREVKSSKSYDSIELAAKIATAENFFHLIRPLQSLLEERLDLKIIRKVDELLRRIGGGLLHNETIQSRQVLMFCHEIIREVYKSSEEHGDRSAQNLRNKRFLINIAGTPKSLRGSTTSYKYKLIRFAFDLLRSILHRYDSLRTPANLAGFMPMMGDALVQSNEEIQMAAIRLLTTIIKVPLREIDDNAALYVSEAVKIIKASPSTNTELAQAALKLTSAILRERRDVEVREIDVAYLLKRIQPDLEESERQGVAFTFLKAVMTRRLIIVEVYEVLEMVASMMITNQTRGARDQARSVYFDFLVQYPQGKGRFAKQLTFLTKNLDYKHHEGRQSVMEAIHLLLSKLSGDLQQTALGTFFVPLVMVTVNDESVPCREMAGALLKSCFEKADSERTETFLTLLRAWLPKLDQPLLARVAIQVFGTYFETQRTRAARDVPFLLGHIARTLKVKLSDTEVADWESVYYALHTFIKVCQVFPAQSFAGNTAPLWASIRQCLSFPHMWVKLSAAKLMGMLFADVARTNAKIEKLELPLQGSNGLWLGSSELDQVTRASLAQLRVPALSEELATQAVRNLVFLGKMMNSTSLQLALEEVGGQTLVEDAVSENEDETANQTIQNGNQSGLAFIFQRSTAILRRGPLTTRAPSLVPVKAAMQLLWALCSNLPAEAIRPHIQAILLPLQNLTDPSIPPPFSTDEAFVEGYRTFISHCAEIMDMLQKKLGTTEYIMHLTKVKEGIKRRREGRRVKRRIEAVTEPEKVGRLKQRKGEKKKEKRKERSAGQRSKRRGW
ncbi:MAG: hypothetical protein Q9200_005466 [Gallowayella weberi]